MMFFGGYKNYRPKINDLFPYMFLYTSVNSIKKLELIIKEYNRYHVEETRQKKAFAPWE